MLMLIRNYRLGLFLNVFLTNSNYLIMFMQRNRDFIVKIKLNIFLSWDTNMLQRKKEGKNLRYFIKRSP